MRGLGIRSEVPKTSSTVLILNRQRKVRVDIKVLRSLFGQVFIAAGASGDVAVILVSDRAIRLINRRWRGVDSPTDCISFPARNTDENEGSSEILGDIFISLETARRQCSETGDSTWSLYDEIVYLFTHSLLHLMGYDHMDDRSRRAMKAAERRILRAVVKKGVSRL